MCWSPGMTAEHVLERLTEGVAVITPGDRSDVVLAVVSAHAAEGFPSLSCIILNGGLELHPSIAKLVAGLGLRLPIIATDFGTFETASSGRRYPRPRHGDLAAQDRHRARTDGHSRRHRGSACPTGDSDPDGRHAADVHLPAAGPGARGPQAHRAARGRRRPHPQGGRAAAAARGGRADHPRRRDGRCGPLSRTRRRPVRRRTVLDPRTSELCDQFAEQYAELRKHKGITVEQARETIHDVSYFGTMLVHNEHGRRHGVGRRAHHRAHRAAGVRDHQDPARRVNGVEHLPDVPGRPGARLRRLCDRPGPDRRATGRHRDQSARTAAQFGIDPGWPCCLTRQAPRARRRRRQGPRSNGTGARAATRPAGGRSHSVRRGRRPDCGGGQDARTRRSRVAQRC